MCEAKNCNTPMYYQTPRGRFLIKETFETRDAAVKKEYGYYFTHDDYDIYTKHITEYSCHFALVPNSR